MKEIKLNNCSYLRSMIKKAEVDETNLEFRNGFAVATATIWTRDPEEHHSIYEVGYTPAFYKCDGLINEQFQELYSDHEQGETRAIRNLMFLKYNESITRVGDNDFIVKTSCGRSGATYDEYRHIRIDDDGPTIINDELGLCQTTTNENLIIVRHPNYRAAKGLYSVSNAAYITPMLFDIKESEVYFDTFNVMARVEPEDVEDSCQYVDYLRFKIDGEGRILSNVLSSLEGYINRYSDISVDNLLDVRAQELAYRAQEFTDLVSSFEKNDAVLEKAGYMKKR